MKRTNLGELEEIILLIVASLHDQAYGISIQEELEQQCDRKISISSVHNVLHRLEEKGFLVSNYGDPKPERGGKRRLLFVLTAAGKKAMEDVKNLRDKLWGNVPAIIFGNP
jgi:PadR family transcriptional regulator PadR